MQKKEKRVEKLTTILSLPIDPELKPLIAEAAYKAGLSMNEWVSVVLAKVLKRPDLGPIPRKPPGRRAKLSRNGH